SSGPARAVRRSTARRKTGHMARANTRRATRKATAGGSRLRPPPATDDIRLELEPGLRGGHGKRLPERAERAAEDVQIHAPLNAGDAPGLAGLPEIPDGPAGRQGGRGDAVLRHPEGIAAEGAGAEAVPEAGIGIDHR